MFHEEKKTSASAQKCSHMEGSHPTVLRCRVLTQAVRAAVGMIQFRLSVSRSALASVSPPPIPAQSESIWIKGHTSRSYKQAFGQNILFCVGPESTRTGSSLFFLTLLKTSERTCHVGSECNFKKWGSSDAKLYIIICGNICNGSIWSGIKRTAGEITLLFSFSGWQYIH